MRSVFVFTALAIFICLVNGQLNKLVIHKHDSQLICVSQASQFFSVGFETQISDSLWIRFLQELDAFNENGIAKAHLCPNSTLSWHFHIINLGMTLDPKFYEMAVIAPLLVSTLVGDSQGASTLFDLAVKAFPNDWRVLYRASYQAQIEEGNKSKAADLLYRAGNEGAPVWVKSLAGGLYNEDGNRGMAEKIYQELLMDEKNGDVADRLKRKLDNKLKNFYTK